MAENLGSIWAELRIKLDKIDDDVKEATTKIEQVQEKLNKGANKFQKTGKEISKVGKTLSKRVTLPLVGLGTAAVKVGKDFDEGMSQVKAISGATETV